MIDCALSAGQPPPIFEPEPWPRPTRPALRAARRRYHRLPITDRPALSDPTSYQGLFSLGDLLTLACCRYWPLPLRTLAWLAEPPRSRSRRRRRRQRRIAAVVRDVLAAELPDALGAIRELERRSS